VHCPGFREQAVARVVDDVAPSPSIFGSTSCRRCTIDVLAQSGAKGQVVQADARHELLAVMRRSAGPYADRRGGRSPHGSSGWDQTDSALEETRFEPLVPSRERVGLLGQDGNDAVGEKDKSRGLRSGASFLPSRRNPSGLTCSGHLHSGSCGDDTAAMIRGSCARGRTRRNIAGDHVARFRQTDHFYAKWIERLKLLPGRNTAARD